MHVSLQLALKRDRVYDPLRRNPPKRIMNSPQIQKVIAAVDTTKKRLLNSEKQQPSAVAAMDALRAGGFPPRGLNMPLRRPRRSLWGDGIDSLSIAKNLLNISSIIEETSSSHGKFLTSKSKVVKGYVLCTLSIFVDNTINVLTEIPELGWVPGVTLHS